MDDTLDSVAGPDAGVPAGTPRRAPGWAQVRAADHVTRYVRHGAGRPVVVLGAGFGEGLWPDLTAALAAHHRVIVPEAPAPEGGFGGWLRGFLDGIGLATITLVAADAFCLPALEFALLDRERLDRLVLILSGTGDADAPGLTGALGATPAESPMAMLVVHRDRPAAEAVRLIAEFLGEPTQGGGGSTG